MAWILETQKRLRFYAIKEQKNEIAKFSHLKVLTTFDLKWAVQGQVRINVGFFCFGLETNTNMVGLETFSLQFANRNDSANLTKATYIVHEWFASKVDSQLEYERDMTENIFFNTVGDLIISPIKSVEHNLYKWLAFKLMI